MRSLQKLKVKEDLAANVIPMVDIMFLLVLFFMLAADMAQKDREVLDVTTAQQVQDDQEYNESWDKRPTVNILHLSEVDCPWMKSRTENPICRDLRHWRYRLKGNEYLFRKEDLEQLEADIRVLREEYDAEQRNRSGNTAATSRIHPSEMRLLVRSDHDAPFCMATRLIHSLEELFIRKLQFAAILEPTKPE